MEKQSNYIAEVIAKYLALAEKEILAEMRAEIERQAKSSRV